MYPNVLNIIVLDWVSNVYIKHNFISCIFISCIFISCIFVSCIFVLLRVRSDILNGNLQQHVDIQTTVMRIQHCCESRVYISILGWSFFSFYAIFENGHIAIDWLYFYEFNSKKSANFQKITRTLQAGIKFPLKGQCHEIFCHFFIS